MVLKEKKLAKKKEDILRSAAKIVSKKGLQGATMEEIAAELLMTKGSLYYYFKNKDDLIYQCHELVLSTAIARLETYLHDDMSSVEKLKKAIATHIEFAINEKEIFNMIIKPQETFSEGFLNPILEIRQHYAEIFDRIINEGIEKGEFNITEMKMARMMILGAMNWIQQWYSPDGSRTKEEISEIYCEYLLKIFC